MANAWGKLGRVAIWLAFGSVSAACGDGTLSTSDEDAGASRDAAPSVVDGGRGAMDGGATHDAGSGGDDPIDGGARDAAFPTSDTGTAVADAFVAPVDAFRAVDGGAAGDLCPASGPTGAGRTYYVAETGSDSADGTEGAPFATLQKAADVVSPGDVVIVEDGTYRRMRAGPTACNPAVACVNRGGTAGRPVTFRARHRRMARIDASGPGEVLFGFQIVSDYVRVEGFEIFGTRGDAGGGGVDLNHNGSGSVIADNHIHDIGRVCTDTKFGIDGIYLSGIHDVIIERNEIHDIGRLGPTEGGCTPTTGAWQNHDHAMYVHDGENITIRNNIVWRIEHGWGVHAYPNVTRNLAIVNNTFALPNPNRDGHVLFAVDAASLHAVDALVANNVFYRPRGVAIQLSTGAGFETTRIANNLVFGAPLVNDTARAGITRTANVEGMDPRLADPAAGDVHPASGSPVRDLGMDLGAQVPNDYELRCRPRGAAYDVGAHELD